MRALLQSVTRFISQGRRLLGEQGVVGWRGQSHLFLIIAVVLLLAVALGMSYLITIPRQKRSELEQELAVVEREYAKELARERAARDHFKWLSDDEYVEQIVRDRENLAKEAETVIHIKPPSVGAGLGGDVPAGVGARTHARENSATSPKTTIVLPPPQ